MQIVKNNLIFPLQISFLKQIKLRKNFMILQFYSDLINFIFLFFSAYDPDSLDPQDFGFLDPEPQKYADPRIRIQGNKCKPKTAKIKLFYS